MFLLLLLLGYLAVGFGYAKIVINWFEKANSEHLDLGLIVTLSIFCAVFWPMVLSVDSLNFIKSKLTRE